jgi:signal transduction histidine kinase
MDEEVVQTVHDIKTNSERCQTIIKNFSNLYQDEDNFKKFDLVNLLHETIILTKSETKGIRKKIECEEDSYLLFSNPTWISQIVFNLVINAGQALFEFFPQEKLRESLIKIRVELDTGRTLIHIEDNGPGIPESIQDKIFNAFVTTKDAGTGLGLAICKSLLNKLDGEIYFHNNPEQGTTFTISLPLEPL